MSVPRLRLIGVFGAASLFAVLAGCWTAADAGVAMVVWGRMVAAWLLGLAIALALARSGVRGGQPVKGFGIAIVLLLLALCFTDSGQQEVYRWIVIGPVRINVAAFVLPPAIVLIGQWGWGLIATIAVMLILAAQPDASQASGFGVAAIMLLLAGKRTRAALASVGAVVVLGMIAWNRPDPLTSVAEVEGIIGLAWQRAPLVAAIGVVSLAVATAAPVVSGFRSNGAAAPALASYMAVTAIAPAIGAFPVPLVGLSMSPIIGFWLGIGALAAQPRASSPPTQ